MLLHVFILSDEQTKKEIKRLLNFKKKVYVELYLISLIYFSRCILILNIIYDWNVVEVGQRPTVPAFRVAGYLKTWDDEN